MYFCICFCHVPVETLNSHGFAFRETELSLCQRNGFRNRILEVLEIMVVFLFDLPVAQNLLSAGVFQYKKTTLQILPVAEEKAESTDAASAAVEIRNIPKSMDKNKLYLFFENKKRSGGGDIADLNFDEARCTAVVTFTDPDGKRNGLDIILLTLLT